MFHYNQDHGRGRWPPDPQQPGRNEHRHFQ